MFYISVCSSVFSLTELFLPTPATKRSGFIINCNACKLLQTHGRYLLNAAYRIHVALNLAMAEFKCIKFNNLSNPLFFRFSIWLEWLEVGMVGSVLSMKIYKTYLTLGLVHSLIQVYWV